MSEQSCIETNAIAPKWAPFKLVRAAAAVLVIATIALTLVHAARHYLSDVSPAEVSAAIKGERSPAARVAMAKCLHDKLDDQILGPAPLTRLSLITCRGDAEVAATVADQTTALELAQGK